MPDLLDEESLDARAQRAARELRTQASTRALPDLHLRSRRPRVAIVAIATVAVVVTGLVLIGTNRTDRSVGNDPSRLRWLVTGLPVGWTATAAGDPGNPDNDLTPADLDSLYATRSAPVGPVVEVSGSDGSVDAELVPGSDPTESNARELTIDGRRAVLADGQDGQRIVYIETGAHWIRLRSRHIDDAALTRMAQAAVRGDDGSAYIPPADLSDGLELVAPPGSRKMPVFFPTGHSVSTYGPSAGDDLLVLMVGRPAASGRALLALMSNPHPATVGDVAGFSGSYLTYRDLYWERDGIGFYLLGSGMTEDALVASATSIRPATAAEWKALANRSSTAPVTQGTTPPPSATTLPSVVRDVPIEVDVTDLSDTTQRWSGTLPTGERWSLRLSRVYDWVSFSGEVGGSSAGASGRIVGAQATATMIQGFDGGAVVTRDSRGVAMRIARSNGDRYTVPLHDMPGNSDLRAAVLGLPGTSPEVWIEMIDADGAVIASYVDGVTYDASGNAVTG